METKLNDEKFKEIADNCLSVTTKIISSLGKSSTEDLESILYVKDRALIYANTEIERLKAEVERMRKIIEVTKLHAISQDCGRMCDNNKNIIYKEQWKHSEEFVNNLIKQALNQQEK